MATFGMGRLDSLWMEARGVLNGRYRRLERAALCLRAEVVGLSCPDEHPLNVKVREMKESKRAEEYRTFVLQAKRLADALKSQGSTKGVPSRVLVPKGGSKPIDGGFRLLDGVRWITSDLATSPSNEGDPSIVQVGDNDTLFAAVSVEDCSAYGGSTTHGCVVVFKTADAGLSWGVWAVVENPSVELTEPSLGVDPYRRAVVLAYMRKDGTCGSFTGLRRPAALVFWNYNDPTDNSGERILDSPSSSCSPVKEFSSTFVGAEFNWGDYSCSPGTSPSVCTCTAIDNWYFVVVTKKRATDANGNGEDDAGGIRIYRTQDCGSTWELVYDGPTHNGSAYDDNQGMMETSNDPTNSSSVCASSNGGDNTLHVVYAYSLSPTDNRIRYLYSDHTGFWGDVWYESDALSGYPHPISQPWLSIARSLNTSTMTHLILFESQNSPTDGDIKGIYAPSYPPSSWSAVFDVEASSVDSRSPTVHTDARWQHCPGAITSSANSFHTSFFHKCPNTYDGPLCNEPPSVYNNTYRLAVLKAPWSSPTTWRNEACGSDEADTIAIDPPPAYALGGYYPYWWNVHGTTFRRSSSAYSPWWFGAMWVYRDTPTDLNVEWTALSCALSWDDPTSASETGTYTPAAPIYYTVDGRRVAGPTKRGIYFVKEGKRLRKVLVR